MNDSPRRPEGEIRVWVDSATEQYAFLVATFGAPGTWSVATQRYEDDGHGVESEVAEIVGADGSAVRIRFLPATIPADPFSGEEPEDRTELMDELMEKATGFASSNPPHHPGSLARYPVPSAAYAHAVSLPMPVLALDGLGQRGLYAPPRVVAIDWQSREPIGVGEFPGFDPESWPPPRLGEWPPKHLAAMPREQLQGVIQRFSACWSRVIDAWFARDAGTPPSLADDIRDALACRSVLDLPTMMPYYEKLNPVFARWLATIQDGAGA
ncbi:MAG: hypothetical protein WBA46_11130 [Thermomicrobiales bacterium]